MESTTWRDEMKAALDEVDAAVRDIDPLTLSGVLTLVVLLLYPGGTPELVVPLRGLCVVGLVFRPLLRWSGFWAGVTVVLAVSYAGAWAEADNHKFLFAYWTLALTMSTVGDVQPDDDRASSVDVLRTNARWLVGLCFAVALTWKLRTPDFWQGAFLHFSFLVDGRFAPATQLISGLDAATLTENRSVIVPSLTAWDGTGTHAQLHTSPFLAAVSQGLAYWTVVVEACIAVAFLWPEGRGPSPWRDVPLLVFVASTYAVAHVGGFAWILIILGVTQVSPRVPYGRLAYLVTLGLVILYGLNLPKLLLRVV